MALLTLPHRYVAPEVMEGDNQYSAEGFGKVDADRFVRFATLPPVLHLQLKRFEFNMQTYSFEKVGVGGWVLFW